MGEKQKGLTQCDYITDIYNLGSVFASTKKQCIIP